MARVEGKSWACHDCKRRKVKCDYRRPTCLRCEKAEIACQGYQRDTLFVNRTPSNLSTTTLSMQKQNSLTRHIPMRSFDEDLQSLTWQVQKQIGPRTQFRLHALELIKKLYLPHQSQVADMTKSSLFSWIPIICELTGESDALDHSLLTFCVVQVAITKAGSACVNDALQFYSSALQRLLVEIEHDGAEQSDEILAAISMLSTYELFVFHTHHTWRAHAQGLVEIVRIRNRMDSSSPLYKSFCSRIRLILLIEALVKRQESSMAISQFRPLMTLSHERDAFHELIDVAFDVPILLEQSDVLIASRNIIPVHLWANIFNSSLLVLEKFYDHYERFRAERAKPLYWAVPASAHNPADDAYKDRLFPFALEFETLENAGQVVFWGALLVQVLCSMIDLHQQFFGSSDLSSTIDKTNTGDGTGPEPLFNSRFPTISSVKGEADKQVRYLCQSIEFCYKMENGTIGPQMTCYAQWVIESYFRKFHYERELAWCLNIKNMKGPGFRHGIELMGFQD